MYLYPCKVSMDMDVCSIVLTVNHIRVFHVSISMQSKHGYGCVLHDSECDLHTVCTVSRAACTLQKGLGTVMHTPWCLERQHCRLVA
jgi:hypothetical protein